jgi:hypothetical protein|tara:strand:+ start:625 stop:906 length:282 start_codon:yes stop_codon:yes gene_type:complete
MATITITLTDTEMLILDHVLDDTDKQEWLQNFAQVKAEKTGTRIKEMLLGHCNANEIAMAVGPSAQIQQAYDLNVIKTVTESRAESEDIIRPA